MVSTTDNANTDSFSTIATWVLSLDAAGYTSEPYTVDLSAYDGMGYIAIRHFDCYDQWFLCIDDVTIVEGEVADGSTTASYVHGTSCTVVATPVEGYRLASWTENNEVVSTSASYTFTVTADRDLVANFEQGEPNTVQTTELSVGSNWWAANVEVTLEQLEAALGTNGIMISSQDGESVAYDSAHGWGGDLTALEIGRMYMVQVVNACTFNIEGSAIDPSLHTITLSHGNNWIGFNGTREMAVGEALEELSATEGDVITAQDGSFASYDPAHGWGGDLFTLEPGQAYIYNSKASADVEFRFKK